MQLQLPLFRNRQATSHPLTSHLTVRCVTPSAESRGARDNPQDLLVCASTFDNEVAAAEGGRPTRLRSKAVPYWAGTAVSPSLLAVAAPRYREWSETPAAAGPSQASEPVPSPVESVVAAAEGAISGGPRTQRAGGTTDPLPSDGEDALMALGEAAEEETAAEQPAARGQSEPEVAAPSADQPQESPADAPPPVMAPPPHDPAVSQWCQLDACRCL